MAAPLCKILELYICYLEMCGSEVGIWVGRPGARDEGIGHGLKVVGPAGLRLIVWGLTIAKIAGKFAGRASFETKYQKYINSKKMSEEILFPFWYNAI